MKSFLLWFSHDRILPGVGNVNISFLKKRLKIRSPLESFFFSINFSYLVLLIASWRETRPFWIKFVKGLLVLIQPNILKYDFDHQSRDIMLVICCKQTEELNWSAYTFKFSKAISTLFKNYSFLYSFYIDSLK